MEAGKVEAQRDSSSLTTEKFLMTRKEVAEMCRISTRSIDREVAEGRLVSTKIRGRVLFSKKALDKWLKKRSLDVS
jgi:excisionase family DNA binding protein